ncbi:helix-turn-helix domain-containing protein [Thermogymnomonas acidicola]|uniref:helix-turn-helix domain-containing protein n=1 Tax=Thermogymnomonas acidicola TaxID=399579 RepID=UPI00166DF366
MADNLFQQNLPSGPFCSGSFDYPNGINLEELSRGPNLSYPALAYILRRAEKAYNILILQAPGTTVRGRLLGTPAVCSSGGNARLDTY